MWCNQTHYKKTILSMALLHWETMLLLMLFDPRYCYPWEHLATFVKGKQYSTSNSYQSKTIHFMIRVKYYKIITQIDNESTVSYCTTDYVDLWIRDCNVHSICWDVGQWLLDLFLPSRDLIHCTLQNMYHWQYQTKSYLVTALQFTI